MEKKFTRAMICEEFKSKCRECPLHCTNNFKSLPCSVLTDDDIQFIMKDYPYADVKVRMIFNDIETRLTAVEKKVENNVSVEFKPERVVFGCSYNRNIGFSAEVVDKKLYDKLEAKHESDCRLISEYDLENKKLNELYKCQYELAKKRLFDFKNVENERDHYKGLYSSKCDDYDRLLEKQIKTEKELKHAEEVGDNYKNLYDTTCDNYEKLYEENNKLIKENRTFNVLLINKTETIGKLGSEYDKLKEERDDYKNLFHSLNHKHQKVVGEMKNWKERYECLNDDYNGLLQSHNKLLKDYKLLSESNNNHATDNIELEGELEAKTNRIAALEEKLRNQRTNLASLQEKYEDALKMNKAREDVYYSNIKLKKTIEAKDREIGLLRAELDKYTKTEYECDDSWID